MKNNSRPLERLTFAALVCIVALSVYYWDFVQKEFKKTHNTLGHANIHVPTADLFLWCVFALILYFGTRFWAVVGPKVFEPSAENAAAWSKRLQLARVITTFTLLALTLNTIYTNVPDFIEKLPWP
jgi:predicted permease